MLDVIVKKYLLAIEYNAWNYNSPVHTFHRASWMEFLASLLGFVFHSGLSCIEDGWCRKKIFGSCEKGKTKMLNRSICFTNIGSAKVRGETFLNVFVQKDWLLNTNSWNFKEQYNSFCKATLVQSLTSPPGLRQLLYLDLICVFKINLSFSIMLFCHNVFVWTLPLTNAQSLKWYY